MITITRASQAPLTASTALATITAARTGSPRF
ncbi:hypothetical protein K376_03236 [Streptomyces sp. PsTaAH-130]|nr:hypothetical protein K376_03236 [Streptomyces sp. PsTaAH-130]